MDVQGPVQSLDLGRAPLASILGVLRVNRTLPQFLSLLSSYTYGQIDLAELLIRVQNLAEFPAIPGETP